MGCVSSSPSSSDSAAAPQSSVVVVNAAGGAVDGVSSFSSSRGGGGGGDFERTDDFAFLAGGDEKRIVTVNGANARKDAAASLINQGTTTTTTTTTTGSHGYPPSERANNNNMNSAVSSSSGGGTTTAFLHKQQPQRRGILKSASHDRLGSNNQTTPPPSPNYEFLLSNAVSLREDDTSKETTTTTTTNNNNNNTSGSSRLKKASSAGTLQIDLSRVQYHGNNNSAEETQNTTSSGASSPERNSESSNMFSRLPPSPTGTRSGVKRISFATDLVEVMDDDSLVEEEEEEKTRHWSTSLFRGSKRDSEDLAEEIANVKRGENSNRLKNTVFRASGGGGSGRIMNVDNSFSSEDIDVAKMFENEDTTTENGGGNDNFEDDDDEEEEYWFHGISVSTQRARSEVLHARLQAAEGETERLRENANESRKKLVELILSAGITREELQPEIEDLREEIRKGKKSGRTSSVETMEIQEEEGEKLFVYDSERIANLLHNFLEKIESYDSTTSAAASGGSSPTNTSLAATASHPGERQQPVALTILTHWARTGDAEAALSRAELEKSRLAHSSAKWTLQSAMQAVKDTMTRETVVKEKLKRRQKILEIATKRKELAHEDLKTAENRLERAQEIRTNMNVALAKAVGDFETSKAALVLWKKRRNGAMMTFKDAINELTEETVIEVNSKTKEFFTRATKASEALSLAYAALGDRLQRALDEGSRHRPEPKDEQNSRALNNDARAAFVAHNRAEQAMNAPISLHFAKLNALESSTRHLLAECEEQVTKGISQFYEAFRVEREAREKSETANLDAKICETTLEVAQSYARTADRAYDDALYFAQSTMEQEIQEVNEAMIVTKRRLEEARQNERSAQAQLSESIARWGKKKALMGKDNAKSPWRAVTRAVNDVHELSTVIRGREMIAKPEDDKVPFPVHYLKDEDGVMKTQMSMESIPEMHNNSKVSFNMSESLLHRSLSNNISNNNATQQHYQSGSPSTTAAAAANGEQGVGGSMLRQTDSQASIASTNSDLESLMQTLSGGSLTAPEAKKRTPVLDKIDKQAEEYENEADVVRATRMVELKARESVEDFSGHAHQTGTFY
jgi:hypothetical protein